MYAQEMRIQVAKRSDMGNAVMNGLRFADTQKSRFQPSNRSNMGSALLEGGPSSDIHELYFQAAKRSDMDCVDVHGCLFLIVRNGNFRSRTFR